MKTDNNYIYRISDLIKAFEKSGYPISASWIYRQERRKLLTIPRSTTNVKSIGHTKSRGGVRILTHNQIWDIVKAFLPGGSGKWHFK